MRGGQPAVKQTECTCFSKRKWYTVFKVSTYYKELGWMAAYFEGRSLFELKNFVFTK